MNVVKVRRRDDGIIVYQLDNGQEKYFLAIRGGLSWPRPEVNMPTYYVIMGEESTSAAQRKEGQRGKLIFVKEYEAPDIVTPLTSSFTKLTDDSTFYLCDTFYTVTGKLEGEDYGGYKEAFQKFMYDKKIAAYLEEAPWPNNPKLGIDYILSWRGKGLLEPGQGILCSQLGMVTNSNEKQIAEALNAVNALRFVVCGFEKYKPNPTSNNWRDRAPRGSWRTG